MSTTIKSIIGLLVLVLLGAGVWWYLSMKGPLGSATKAQKATVDGPEAPIVYPPGVGTNQIPDPGKVH